MIEVLPESQGNVMGIKASDKVTAQDYEEVLTPRLEAVLKEHGSVRFLYLLDEDFQGFELGAMWDDAKVGLKHRKEFDKVALVAAARWMEVGMKLFAPLLKGELKSFPREQLSAAWEWLKS
jgi:hypothetical protein